VSLQNITFIRCPFRIRRAHSQYHHWPLRPSWFYVTLKQCVVYLYVISIDPSLMKSIRGQHNTKKAAGGRKRQQILLTAASPTSVEVQAFAQLHKAAKIKSCLELKPVTEEGNGLFVSQRKSKNDVSELGYEKCKVLTRSCAHVLANRALSLLHLTTTNGKPRTGLGGCSNKLSHHRRLQ